MSYNEISFFKLNKKRTENYNTWTDYIGYRYFRILKTFESDITGDWKGKTFADAANKEVDLLTKFLLRFYIPIEAFARQGRLYLGSNRPADDPPLRFGDDPRIDHLVIMINGLDEHEEFFLKQYDFLGASFAEENVASVLLSTPFHLHRTVKFSKNGDGEASDRVLKPSDVILDNWENWFYLYDVTFQNILALIRKIRNSDTAGLMGPDYGFYKAHFNPNCKITLLGYSLGGLIAFGCFVENWELINKLVLFNAPGSLRSASTRQIGIEGKRWHAAIDDLEANEQKKRDFVEKERSRDFNYANTFKALIIKPVKTDQIGAAIKGRSDKILQIMCGGDSVVDTEPWRIYFDKPTDDKLIQKWISQYVFSGVGHNPMLETKGSEIMPQISRIITDHVLHDERHWQENDIEKGLMKLLAGTKTYDDLKRKLENATLPNTFTIVRMEKLLKAEFGDDPARMEEFLKFFYLSKMYFPRFDDLIEKRKQKDERRTKDQGHK